MLLRARVVFGAALAASAALFSGARGAEGGLSPQRARPAPAAFHSGRIFVRFTAESTQGAASTRQLRRVDRVLSSYRLVPDLSLVEVGDGDVEAALAFYGSRAEVRYAERDFVVRSMALPNDPALLLQWGVRNVGQTVNGDPGTAGADVGAAEAWDVWTGSSQFRVAVIDSGINVDHADLRANLWLNIADTPDNGLDDDGNGWVDDFYGYNTLAESGNVADDFGHGSRMAGLIGAVADNGMGMAGLNWRCKLVALKFSDFNGEGLISDAIEALEYAVINGITVSNNSWGCYACYSQALYDAIEASQAMGHIFVAAAGNGFLGLGLDIAEYPLYPAAYDLPNIISVAASDNDDQKAKFSNYGSVGVDVAAPGVNVYSTTYDGGYTYASGTSYSAAYVTGAISMLRSRRPDLDWLEVRERVLLSVRPVDAFRDVTVTGGVLDMAALVGDCNRNGSLDDEEIADGTVPDCNLNGVLDVCEPDCNGNQVMDACDIRDGVSLDCDANGVPDDCQPDCNGNGRGDACDIDDGASSDCNVNGVPDECEPGSSLDCNGTGRPDLCDLYDGTSFDCNGNRRPDECDIASHTSADCTGNGLPDECERDCNENGGADSCDILVGTSADNDQDGVPDECVLGLHVVPVHSTGDFTIDDREIFVLEGAQRIRFEIRLSGWDPDQDGEPRLGLYEVTLDPAGLTSGERGSLRLAEVPCLDNDDCLATSICLPTGRCDADGSLNVDEQHPDYVFSGLPTISGGDPAGFRFASLLFDEVDQVIDPGESRYVGTLILELSADALGTFTMPILSEQSLLRGGPANDSPIAIPGFQPAVITILPDCNHNGVLDEHDIRDGNSMDCDGDGAPDECVAASDDCNGNLVPDVCDVRDGTSPDCNENGVPDECAELEADCNQNGIPDACDLADGSSTDCNGNGIPDDCLMFESDCNENAVPDACDIASGTSGDCNGNLLPDDCEADCNANGLADDCDIERGTSLDRDENEIPDECQRFLRVPSEYATIQGAIDAAVPGDTVLLADGTYTGAGNVQVSFRGKAITVRSEGGPQRCIIDAAGATEGFVFSNRETGLSRLEGVTVTRGRICGVFCVGSSPTIHNCILKRNGPVSGGIYCLSGGTPTISHCTITENSNAFSGGGVFCDQASPTISHCVITRNNATEGGGGVFGFVSSMTIVDSLIADNFAQTEGGGVYLIGGAPVIKSCRIGGNLVAVPSLGFGDGGGLYLLRTNATVGNCVITGNEARRYGGGIYLEEGDPVVANCTIAGNLANKGGGVYRFGGEGETFACCLPGRCDDRYTQGLCEASGGTFYPGLRCRDVECGTQSCCVEGEGCENRFLVDCLQADGAPQGPGTQCSTVDCTPSISNSIIWQNAALAGGDVAVTPVRARIVYSTVGSGWPGLGNEYGPPGFVIPGTWEVTGWVDGDYHLSVGSVEIDTGDQRHVPPVVQTDFDGHARVLCGQVDRGVYEHGIGDFDCNGVVELSDFGEWVGCVGGLNGDGYVEACRAFDFDADSDVDLTDYARFQNQLVPDAP